MITASVMTDTTVCPEFVDRAIYGDHSSQVIKYDLQARRVWKFEDHDKAAAFVRAVRAGKFRRGA
jgi:hypothetical protein